MNGKRVFIALLVGLYSVTCMASLSPSKKILFRYSAEARKRLLQNGFSEEAILASELGEQESQIKGAIIQNDTNELSSLLEQSGRNKKLYMSALAQAIVSAHIDVVTTILRTGVIDVNTFYSEFEKTPLEMALALIKLEKEQSKMRGPRPTVEGARGKIAELIREYSLENKD